MIDNGYESGLGFTTLSQKALCRMEKYINSFFLFFVAANFLYVFAPEFSLCEHCVVQA